MEKVFLWGAGLIAKRILNQFDLNEFSVLGFIDNNKDKQDKVYNNYNVFSPDVLENVSFDKIIIMSYAYEDIVSQITTLYKVDKEKIEDRYFIIKKSIINRYIDSKDPEIKDIINYLDNHDLQVFNYDFTDKYINITADILFDYENEMFHVLYKGKKMYFSKKLDTKEKVLNYYRSICLEQDPMSPHVYFDDEFMVCDGDVIVDLGVAEGNFSLDIIDKVSKLYIIEGDNDWVEALKLTFKDFSTKVVIINKFISDICNEDYDILDNLIKEPIDFLKMDVEGYEYAALKGAKNLFDKSTKIRCNICAYHRESNEKEVCDLLTEYGMRNTTTKGYMWYPLTERNDMYSTDLRRGVIRSER